MEGQGVAWEATIRGKRPRLDWVCSERVGRHRDLLMRDDGSTPSRISFSCTMTDTIDVSVAFDDTIYTLVPKERLET
jgi:hypothetical protein